MMAVVTLQIGQCGNQIGCDFFSTLMSNLEKPQQQHRSNEHEKEFKEVALERFFHKDDDTRSDSSSLWQARAVMIDMESKVISESLSDAKSSGLWKYPDKQQFFQKRGSGNNWAHGYCVHGPKASNDIMNMIQREVEKCDHFGGFLTLMSLAGGTGSGVGAHITRCLRDEFPNCFIVNQVVWPYTMGEVIVQNYNAVLTLSHLYQTTDAILAMDNDSLHEICARLMAVKSVSFRDINQVISHKMSNALLPVYPGLDSALEKSLIKNHIGEMLEFLVPHPEYKLLTVRNIPQMSKNALQYSSYQWHGLLKHLHQMIIANAAYEEGINWQIKVSSGNQDYNKCISNLLILRGKELEKCDTSAFSQSQLYVPWTSASDRFQTWSHPREFDNYEKSATLLSNSQAPVETMTRVVDKAWTMFAARAYVHQYLKHGMTEEGFVDSFATLEQVVANYKNLHSC